MPSRRKPAPYLSALGALALTVAFGGMAAAQTEAETEQPINCSTAEGDIRALESEKEVAQDHVVRNVAAITPAGALLGIVTGTEGEHLQMLSGEYEKRIDERIAAIKAKCG